MLRLAQHTTGARAQQLPMAVRPMVAVLALRKVQWPEKGCLHDEETFESIPSRCALLLTGATALYMHMQHLHERQKYAADQQILTGRSADRDDRDESNGHLRRRASDRTGMMKPAERVLIQTPGGGVLRLALRSLNNVCCLARAEPLHCKAGRTPQVVLERMGAWEASAATPVTMACLSRQGTEQHLFTPSSCSRLWWLEGDQCR